jgi:membrane protein implicated in regulation of membrane protease activity
VKGDDPRQRVIRRATLYARVFAAAAIVVALAGSALIARFALPGLPFLTAWLLVLGTVGTGVLLILGARTLLERNRRDSGSGRDSNGSIDSHSEG